MKKLIITCIIMATILVMADNLHAMVNWCEEPECGSNGKQVLWEGGDQSAFQRTYQHRKSVHRKKTAGSMAQTRSGNGPVITKADLEDHLALDKKRTLTIIPVGSTVIMDVQGIDETGDQPQVWNMPDFEDYSPVERDIQHITPESSGYEDEYPGTTHAFYQATDGLYRMYELTEDDLFAMGSIDVDENGEVEIWDLFYTLTPLPLEWGLDFEGVVIIEYTEDPEVDSTIAITRSEVVGYGTLNTYDEGPVQALKLHVNLSFTDYKDGQVVYDMEEDYVVWYSEEGHYLLGLVELGAPMTGEVMFTHMQYHSISESVSVDPSNPGTATLNYFPNPVSAGDVLTVTHTTDTHFGLVRLYDMQGRLVQQLDLSGMGAVRNFQVQLPSDLVAGMYMYQVQSPKGESLGQGKLNVR